MLPRAGAGERAVHAAVFDTVALEGRYVRLEPIGERHREGLNAAIRDGELWKLFYTLVPHPDEVGDFVRDALRAHEAADGLVFATVDRESGEVAGSTRFMHANARHRRVEIGFSFLGKSWQRSRLNTEAKLLMLSHAFETLSLHRVELLTDYLNVNSRRAILRLGAKEEGILRNHMLMPDGRIRDSVIFSVTHHEWPGVRQNLNHLLG